MAKKTAFEWQKCVPNVIFPRFRGGIWSIKVVSDFCFGDWKCHFWYPQNRKYCAKYNVSWLLIYVPYTCYVILPQNLRSARVSLVK